LPADMFSIVDEWLGSNYYDAAREWCYKNIPRRIICEEFIEPHNQATGLLDYRFWCFHGTPIIIMVDADRYANHTRTLYDCQWRQLPALYRLPGSDQKLPCPRHLDEMLAVAEELSSGHKFIRVDLYCEDRVRFGELTFYPGAGFAPFIPEDFDYELGAYLNL
jgi:hypothetical protein